jgi:hypothetical protein
MREFARLYAELDATTATNRKLAALKRYFSSRRAAGRRLGRVFPRRRQAAQAVPTKLLRDTIEYAGIDEWLFEECHKAVGDLAETIAHMLPPPAHASDLGLAVWMLERIAPLKRRRAGGGAGGAARLLGRAGAAGTLPVHQADRAAFASASRGCWSRGRWAKRPASTPS